MKVIHSIIVIGIALVVLSGCAGKSSHESFTREGADLSFIQKVAVMPFENNSKDQFAGHRLRDFCITNILAKRLFDVEDKGIVDALLEEEGIDNPATMSKQAIKRLGQQLNTQAILLGTIDTAKEGRRGSTLYPEISLTLRLVDTGTGIIFWQASGTRNGDSTSKRLLGLATDDVFSVSNTLASDLLNTIDLTATTIVEEETPEQKDN